MMANSVVILENTGSIIDILRKGIEMIGGFNLHTGPVLIKPNICTVSDNTGHSVTDVRVVEAVIDLLLEEDKSLSIRVVESDSESKYADEAFDKFGYTNMTTSKCDIGYDVNVVNLSKSQLRKVEFEGLYFNRPELPAEITNHSYYISIAIPKTHYLTHITGTLKNQFGLLPRKAQGTYHSDIQEIIIDLNQLVKPDLCIFDARVGVERWNGPKTHQMDLFVVGRNAASTDAIMARLMGFNPEEIDHIRKASKQGVGNINPEVLGKAIEDVCVLFKSPK